MKADLILKNIGKLVTMQGSSNFKVKEEMNICEYTLFVLFYLF